MRSRSPAVVALLLLTGTLPLLGGSASAASTPGAAPAGQSPGSAGPSFVRGELIVSFRRSVSDKAIRDLYRDHGISQDEDLDADTRDRDPEEKVVETRGAPVARVIDRLERDRRVEYAEPNYILTAADHPVGATSPTDPMFHDLWGLHNFGQVTSKAGASAGTVDADTDALDAWEVNRGSPTVIVGVIDSGVDYNHPDLAANMWRNPGECLGAGGSCVSDGADNDGNGVVDDFHGVNTIPSVTSGNPMDDNGHGTHVSGTIGAIGNNGIGVVGVNWNVRIAACKFLNSAGSGTTSDAVECFKYFNLMKNRKGQNILVTNNSWGGAGFSQALMDAMAGKDQQDPANPPVMPPVLHAAAAGNSNANNDTATHYPDGYNLDNIVSVAATDKNDLYASFTNWGATKVDLAAPGVDVLSTYIPGKGIPGGGYHFGSGTSMATPHVAGAAALVWAANAGFSASQVKQRILSRTDYIGNLGSNASKPTLTGGRLNVLNAVENDTIAPAAVTTLAVSGVTSSSATLAWTATGDDGTTGTASSYDLRYSTSSITEANWASATQATGEPKPKPAEQQETFSVSGLVPNTTYHFALKVKDNVGNVSSLSNVPSGTTATGPVTLQVTDGWDQKNDKTLVEDGKVSVLQQSDNDRVQVEAARLWTFQFGSFSFPSNATIQSVNVNVEHHEESGFGGSVAWQVYTGGLKGPPPDGTPPTTNATIRPGSGSEATDMWDVTAAIDTPTEVNGAKFVVRNKSTNGRKSKLDRVWLLVEYSTVDTTAPDTTITSGPAGNVSSNSATFEFTSNKTGATFECRLDSSTDPAAWATCTSPKSYMGLAEGSHTFEVRAKDAVGTDATPASRAWTVDTLTPETTMDSGPTGTVTSRDATFTFSSEPGAAFECRLDGGAFAACTSPKSYSGLADGSHTFEVRAKDAAGNTDPTPATRTWTVDSPPDTSIISGPSGTVSSNSATFTYSSTESPSTFECKLDSGAFAPCPASGQTYNSLSDGSHTFEVRATDAAGNTDPSPAARTWTIDATPPVVSSTTPAPGATGVSTGARPTATFNEAMDPSTITSSTFTMKETESGSAVAGTVSYNGVSRTATFATSSSLAPGTSYTAAVSTDVRDAAGNAMASAHTWSFTTGAAPAVATTLHLRNQPPPQSGDTPAQTNVLMDADDRFPANLHRFSTDLYSSLPGRLVEKLNTNGAQAESKYMMNWVYQVPADLTFSGPAELTIWVALKDHKCDKTVSFEVYLRDKASRTASAGSDLARVTTTSDPQGSEPCGFQKVVVPIPLAGKQIARERWLELKVTVNESTGDSALFAYDAAAFPAKLMLP